MFNGHGADNLIAGHKNQVIIESPKDVKLLKEFET